MRRWVRACRNTGMKPSAGLAGQPPEITAAPTYEIRPDGLVLETFVIPGLVFCVPSLGVVLGMRQGLLRGRVGVERPHQPIHGTLVRVILDCPGTHVEPVGHENLRVSQLSAPCLDFTLCRSPTQAWRRESKADVAACPPPLLDRSTSIVRHPRSLPVPRSRTPRPSRRCGAPGPSRHGRWRSQPLRSHPGSPPTSLIG